MPDPSTPARPLPGPGFTFLVTDEHGAEHDVSALVEQVVLTRQAHKGQLEEYQRQERNGSRDIVEPSSAWVAAGFEVGIKAAVSTLYGEAAEKAFSAECERIDRFLRETDTARH